MSHSPSVLLPYSVESFFSDDDVRHVLRSIDTYKAANPGRLQAGAHGISIHQSPNLTLSEVISVYEPAGRLDINAQHIPRDVVDIAECAFYRHIEDIRRAYPATHGPFGFTYVEYTVGQYFTPHADGVGNDQKVGFGVTLTDDFEGGEFVVQTCGSNRLWAVDTNGRLMLGPGHDASSEWFNSLPKTEWLTRPKRGNAIFYGGALTHGSRPVTKGVLKKLLGFTR
jgi:2OG-Fe(II) oxygenase superfamily